MSWSVRPVIERRRHGRRRPERTCCCGAVGYPHRVGSIPGCIGDLTCAHGAPMPGHPDYDGRCPECDREEYADILSDTWRDDRLR